MTEHLYTHFTLVGFCRLMMMGLFLSSSTLLLGTAGGLGGILSAGLGFLGLPTGWRGCDGGGGGSGGLLGRLVFCLAGRLVGGGGGGDVLPADFGGEAFLLGGTGGGGALCLVAADSV